MEDHISVIFNVFSKHGVKVHLMQNSALNFSVCADVKPTMCDGLIAELSDSFLVRYNEDVDLFTVRHYKTLDLPEKRNTRRYSSNNAVDLPFGMFYVDRTSQT